MFNKKIIIQFLINCVYLTVTLIRNVVSFYKNSAVFNGFSLLLIDLISMNYFNTPLKK